MAQQTFDPMINGVGYGNKTMRYSKTNHGNNQVI